MPRWPKKQVALKPQEIQAPAVQAEVPKVVNLHTETLTHTRPLTKLYTIVITGPDGKTIARYEQIPGYVKQEAIDLVKAGVIYEAHLF